MSREYNDELLFSVSLQDCETQTFKASGPGGQNVNKRLTGVRIIHHPSGARAECRETRSQLENKRRAFKRMAESALFRGWVAVQTGRIKSDEQIQHEVAAELADPSKLKIEVGNGKRWRPLAQEEA